MLSLESPHRGDSIEYTQYTIFDIKKKITLNYLESAVMGFFFRGFKNRFETAMVNEPSVFEPLKVYSSDKYSKTFMKIDCKLENWRPHLEIKGCNFGRKSTVLIKDDLCQTVKTS